MIDNKIIICSSFYSRLSQWHFALCTGTMSKLNNAKHLLYNIVYNRSSYFVQKLWSNIWQCSQHWRCFCVEQGHFVGNVQVAVGILILVRERMHWCTFTHQHSSVIAKVVLNRWSSHLKFENNEIAQTTFNKVFRRNAANDSIPCIHQTSTQTQWFRKIVWLELVDFLSVKMGLYHLNIFQ